MISIVKNVGKQTMTIHFYCMDAKPMSMCTAVVRLPTFLQISSFVLCTNYENLAVAINIGLHVQCMSFVKSPKKREKQKNNTHGKAYGITCDDFQICIAIYSNVHNIMQHIYKGQGNILTMQFQFQFHYM